METTNIKKEPEAHHDKNESFETPTNINNKRKSESLIESNNSNLETSQTSISPQSNASSSNLVTGREKRIRKIKAYDDDFLMYDMPSCSNSSIFQNLTKQMIPAQENTNEIKYNLGDLVWAKVSGHPWWPCMITNPELSATNSIKNYNETKNENAHLRLIGGSRPKRSYYVEFFGPSIEHAWVPEGNIIEYKGIEEFKAYTQEQIDRANSKSAKDKLTEKFSLKITLPKRDGWDQAIVEADSFINKKIRDRKIHFINKHIETGIIKKENSFELEEPKINNKNKRNSIDSNEESFQNETKKVS
ncbi:unnamed protein product [Brachionus calyciflorus]|uniref:PWWP domain-containing protein n=1 Tax=Brachionus calyciflorus TaxID=104777 RepID=A0A813UG12_9BILA|nr:unnamed protein product [Brachionus calyciflorus]